MIEYKKKKVLTSDLDDDIKLMSAFDYALEDKKILGYKSKVIYKREMDTPYYNEMIELEKGWNKKHNHPAWPTYLLLALAFITLTVFLVLYMINKSNIAANAGNIARIEELKQLRLVYLFAVLLPGVLFFMLGSAYFYFRVKKIQKSIMTFFEDRREVLIKSKEIKDKYENK